MRKTPRLSAGFGHSDWPDPKRFDYTLDHIASVIDDFTQAVGLSQWVRP
jgi:pimeloyl-ACP methyl ester carboxylesterase